MKTCPCIFKKQMITEMLDLPVKYPDDQYNWASLLFENTSADSPCCLLTFLFYYAYCRECSVPLSEEARTVLKPLMEPID